jgi:hypothetical protein
MNPHSAILLMLLHLVELFEIVVSRAQIILNRRFSTAMERSSR